MTPAPTSTMQNKGIDDRRIKLGCVQPGEAAATFGDALRRLSDQATHVYVDQSRYWLATQPSVTRLAQDRAAQLERKTDEVHQEIVKRIREEQAHRGEFVKVYPCPPNSGEVPDGYFVARSRTYGNIGAFRGFIVNWDPRPSVESIKRHLRVYPLAGAANPPAMRFVDFSGAAVNLIPANDATFFDDVNAVVQEEPLEATEPETRGLLASVGIQKGKPFAPDDRLRRILAEAAAVGNATARAIVFRTRDRAAYYYPDSSWKMLWIGNDYEFSPAGVLNLDARTLLFYVGQGVSPAMTVKMVGLGSQYASTEHDAAGHYLDGAKTYRLHLPGGIPAKDFWSVVVYDPQTRSMLQTDQQFPSTGSQKQGLLVNPDTSVDVYFGPKAPEGMESNWVQTIPGKGWFTILRLYGPLEPWFDKSWRPGEITLQKQ